MDLTTPTEMAIDPVCGMEVDPKAAIHTAEHGGQTYYFCSRGCMLDFQEAPDTYLDPAYEPKGMDGMGGH